MDIHILIIKLWLDELVSIIHHFTYYLTTSIASDRVYRVMEIHHESDHLQYVLV